jgi:hypothetical protein
VEVRVSSLRWIAMGTALAAIATGFWFRSSGRQSQSAPLETRPPSILLVTIDTLRADHCSAYG